MMGAIMLFLRLTYEARAAPAIKGMLATNPHRRESKIVLLVDETSYISPWIRGYNRKH
jgi:hypothetical protein